MEKLNTKNDVYTLLYGSTATAALGTAIETGLVWLLAEKPLDGEGVAQALNITSNRCHYWLQFLYSLGILDKSPQGYVPSTLAREAILATKSQESWKYLVREARETTACVQDLADYIREPGSIWTAQGLQPPIGYVEKMRQDPSQAREFTRMLFEVHQPLANRVVELLDLTGVQRLMDLGGGSGVVSMALLRKYPELTSTVVDIENVCIAGREIAEEEGLAGRISYHSADFTGDEELPAGFDLVLQCDVGVFGLAIFQKLYRSLNPGGELFLVDHIAAEDNSAPASRVEWTFRDSLHDPNFSFPTLRQIEDMLAQVGFGIAKGYPGQHSGMTLIRACKS